MTTHPSSDVSARGMATRAVALEEAAYLTPRQVFLLEMYKQCSAHLNRHVSSVWQCLAVIAGAAATVGFDATKDGFDYVVAMALFACAWFAASSLDSNAWFNRNMTIISNIERCFLSKDDAKIVHPFFLDTHRHDRLITHFRIQLLLAASIASVLLTFHAFQRQLMDCTWTGELSRLLPLAVATLSLIYLFRLRTRLTAGQLATNLRSPGTDLTS